MKRRRENLKFSKFILHPVTYFIVDGIFILGSYTLATDHFFVWRIADCETIVTGIFLLWLAAVLVRVFLFAKSQMTIKEYRRLELSDKLSAAMLRVQQRSNAYKTRHVTQITYGKVPTWHPFNYYENVLVYDVHEQIRTILLELKDAVLSTIPEFDHDAVTVDLVYCYTDKDNDGKLPADQKISDKWRLITSRDGSSMNYKVHDFLESNESFYFFLDQNNYVFFNDKQKEKRYYIPSGKDQEYDLQGSIVGLTINVKNDVPEAVLVKAMLTITTYGRKLVEKSDEVAEDDYKDLFKKNVLNGYKSLLESELAQMYIRHMIREGGMCPYSGIITQSNEHEGRGNEQTPKSSTVYAKVICNHQCSTSFCKCTRVPCVNLKENDVSENLLATTK